MFEPEKLLKDLDLNSLTPKQARLEIKKLADSTRPDMSWAYYIQRMGAISILAELAAEGLPE
jgi:hypothetical protein